jgi:formylglycine-generating enzyme required for sulfatase activity
MNGTDPVGSYPLGVSANGCFDLAGNVGEWVRDIDPETGKHVVVGGSWQDPVYTFVDAHSRRLEPNYADDATGFRLAMDVGEGE